MQETSWLSWLFEKLVMVMVVYFIVSIIHSMAQSYHKQLAEQQQQQRSPSTPASKTQDQTD